MLLHEVLSCEDVQKGVVWFRPLFWEGSGQALSIHGGIKIEPSFSHDVNWNPRLEDLKGEWQICPPSTVLNEIEV